MAAPNKNSTMMKITCRFYEALNDFLPTHLQKRAFIGTFKGRVSVKDKIEALGVPHTEVDLILVNGNSVDFSYILQDGDQISIYPVFETLDIEGVTRLRPMPLGNPKFIADVNIHDIVKTMRALGLDVFEDVTLSHREIVRISRKENRTILTGSPNLLKRKQVTHGIFIRPGNREEQVRRIVDRLSLPDLCNPFSRCLRCNTLLEGVAKDLVWERIPPKTRRHCKDFARCPTCDRLFWKGTHYQKIKAKVDRILGPLFGSASVFRNHNGQS